MNEEMTLLMAQLKQFKRESDGADVHGPAPGHDLRKHRC